MYPHAKWPGEITGETLAGAGVPVGNTWVIIPPEL